MDVLQQPRNDSPARMDRLAKLPVFWALEGKRVVVAGGTDAAAWKAELLAACGAEVHVYAEQLSETFQHLIAQGAAHPQGRFIHHPHAWDRTSMIGATIAIADCEQEDEAQAFFDAARDAGVPVNVIDKPAFCQFQFGSIVNRSPVVVSISTDGASPILAQAIRRRIETLLPQALKGWAQLAQSLREVVNQRLATAPLRRAFWERFVDRAFSSSDTPEEGVGGQLLDDADRLLEAPASCTCTGRVTLVGAGPGDAELLTLKAVRALQAADVILFDDLVSSEVLELARREAKRMLVGKRGGRTSCRQEDINEMMVKLAKAGKRVVRLKSGDPMIFGRAGEEIAHLDRENIPVDVIPGITAASAMASCLGISLTHRDHAQSVRFITGHSRSGGLPVDVNWAMVADPHTTTVFYMGGRTAALIADRLTSEGLSPSTPAVIISDVSRTTQRHWRGQLETIRDGIAAIGYEKPVLIAVGLALAAGRKIVEVPDSPAGWENVADIGLQGGGGMAAGRSIILSGGVGQLASAVQ
jgi:uroporphyrin-III C-methyltransferase/precorrin-2 dehydrogenase/sirohydrochlorin ferrochelatase